MSSVQSTQILYTENKDWTDNPFNVFGMEDTMKYITTVLTITLIALFTGVGMAASDRCIVEKSEGRTLVITCKKDTGSFKPGSEIKIKTSRKKAALEGC